MNSVRRVEVAAPFSRLGRANPAVWWINPAQLPLFLTLPAVVLSSLAGGPIMYMYNSVNFLDEGAIVLASACVLSLALGGFIGSNLILNSRGGKEFRFKPEPERLYFI
jgi:hypothetical protein